MACACPTGVIGCIVCVFVGGGSWGVGWGVGFVRGLGCVIEGVM